MYKHIAAVTLTAGLIMAPLPMLVRSAAAQSIPAKNTTAKKTPSGSQLALRERQRKCGAEWKAAKKAGKVEKGTKWPQYWSACNKRLKTSG